MTTTHPPAHAAATQKITDLLADFRLALEQQRQFRLEQLDELAAVSVRSLGGAEVPDEVHSILIASATAALTEVEAALGRIHAGLYGSCERCAKVIPIDRLEILPMSRYCMSCQHCIETGRSGIRLTSRPPRGRPASRTSSPSRRHRSHSAMSIKERS
jgi:RNA polymerase-binding transcription factor DksA